MVSKQRARALTQTSSHSALGPGGGRRGSGQGWAAHQFRRTATWLSKQLPSSGQVHGRGVRIWPLAHRWEVVLQKEEDREGLGLRAQIALDEVSHACSPGPSEVLPQTHSHSYTITTGLAKCSHLPPTKVSTCWTSYKMILGDMNF